MTTSQSIHGVAQGTKLSFIEWDFPKLNVIKLEQNYRSSERILKGCKYFIANNPSCI